MTRTMLESARPTTARSALAIEASELVKVFGNVRAVDGIDLAVRTGSVYGVLGPNGAGKTTTIKMLATLLRPDAGSARVLGYDIVRDADAVRGVVSLTGQFASVDEDLTGRENLVLLARLLGFTHRHSRTRAVELLDAFDLGDAGNRLVKTYSGGMRRRLDIAASIVVTPQLMFLDEPTTGLDPRSRNQVWDIIRALVAEGTTILLCTQYLEEADQLADGIAVIDHGKVIAEGTPAQLKAPIGLGALHIRLLDPEQRARAEQLLADDLGGVHREPDPAALSAPCADAERAADAIAGLSRSGIGIAGFSLGQPSLDEVFLALTGQPADHGDAAEAWADARDAEAESTMRDGDAAEAWADARDAGAESTIRESDLDSASHTGVGASQVGACR
jgi:daunorubicin/doxorubicin transport system ATP-binding protein